MSHIHYNNLVGLLAMICVISPLGSAGIPEMHRISVQTIVLEVASIVINNCLWSCNAIKKKVQRLPPATSQVIAAYYLEKLHRFSQF